MSYKVAENVGPDKIKDVLDLLNSGARYDAIASLLGVSVSRACRIINALFKPVWIPKEHTQAYLENKVASDFSRAKWLRDDVREIQTVRAMVIPFVKHGRNGKKTAGTNSSEPRRA